MKLAAGRLTGLLTVICALMGSELLAEGDPARGRQLATECFACHGEDGNSPSPVNPKIGGQHELYLLLAMQAYLNGTRADSLMRGAVLNKSEQDLADIAAYYAGQNSDLPAADVSGPPAGEGGPAPGGPPRGGPRVIKFDHGERTAEFSSMLARAQALVDGSQTVSAAQACAEMDGRQADTGDADGDGLMDAYDAAPEDAGEFAGDVNGDGRYEICNIYQLQAIANLGGGEAQSTPLDDDARRARSYQLTRDLDASPIENFEPIGNCGPTGNCMVALGQFGFAGVFDGQGHTISHLNLSWKERGGVSLFGVLAETGVIMNLELEDARVEGRGGTGGLVGSNFGVIYDCRFSGRVSGNMAIGGLVGGSGGLVYRSRAQGEVSGQQAVGGLVGDMTGAVYYSESTTRVSGRRGIGGLVGLNTFGSVLGSHASGAVSGSNDIGGLVGVNTDAKVRNSFATGGVTGEANNIGGLVGFNSLSTVRNSYARGVVTGVDAVGGLVGRNNGAVGHSFATGPVSSDGTSGALTGILVEGMESGNLAPEGSRVGDGTTAVNLQTATGDSTGWAPTALPATKPLEFFCDNNRNGFIDPEERAVDNYVWEFGGGDEYPAVRCAAGGLTAQRQQ